MRWKDRRASENVEDRRRPKAAGVALGGGLMSLVVIVIVILLGGDPAALLQMQGGGGGIQGGGGPPINAPADDSQKELKEFVSVVLADTEDVWNERFNKDLGRPYREPTLILFNNQVQSACGFASAATGPFYCPADQKVYIDLSFYDELRNQLQAPGDFAMAYVVAHEIGHHVQQQLGMTDKVHGQRRSLSEAQYNQQSVRLELQADYLAGVWAHHAQRTKQILEEGDVEEAMNAANQIGDDRLQKQSRGYVVPDSFTHGSSEQRVRWFRRGLESGDLMGMNALFELDYDEL